MARNTVGFYQEVIVAGVNEHNSVSSGPDNNANNQMACAFWNCMRHATSQQAAANFLSRLPSILSPSRRRGRGRVLGGGPGACNMGGHGNEGIVTTGCGQTGTQSHQNFMVTWNAWAWEPHFSQLKPKVFPILSIWSCHTGAGEDGADFLFEFAKVIDKPVRARTGFTYSNTKCQVWFENGSDWQVATPTLRPPAKHAPTPHYITDVATKSTRVTLLSGRPTAAQVHEVALTRQSRVHGTGATTLVDEKGDRDALVAELAAIETFELPGAPSAIATASLSIAYAGKSARRSSVQQREQLLVYNDRLVVSATGKIAAYAGPVLRGLLKLSK